MKLVLSSCDFRNEFSRRVIQAHLPKPIAQCRVLFIPNEKWTAEKLDGGVYQRRMQEHGFSQGAISVFDPRRPEAFATLDPDVVYASGGNSFLTLDLLRRSRFAPAVVRYIHGGAVYIGGSAGAHIVTANLAHLTPYDQPPANFVDFKGLNLFPGVLLCHFSADRKAHYRRLAKECAYPVYALTDDESIVFTGARHSDGLLRYSKDALH